jgi:glycosyltransferase involved in cell wall biosynthesis
MEISVILCAYSNERWHDLVAAVQSVQGQHLKAAEIVVVIDHNPALLERARAELLGVKVVENMGRRGLSGARNSGVTAARGAVIAFLDDDAVAAPDWLDRLAAGYTQPWVIGVGGAIEPLWPSARPAWFPEEFDWVVGCTYRGMPQEQRQVQRLIGCNMSFRREVFASVGGFHSELGRVGKRPLAGEETEFSIRVCRRWPHYRLIYDPQARVRHRVPTGRARWGYFRARCYCEGLSKALIARRVGAAAGLEAERAYTLRTLPGGVVRGIADALLCRQPAGLARAGTILAGLAITAAGYAAGALHFTVGGKENVREATPL